MQDLMLVKEKGGSYDKHDLLAMQKPDKVRYDLALDLDPNEFITQANVKKGFR